LKGSQGSLFEDVRLYLDDPVHTPALSVSEPEMDGDDGWIKTRQAFVCSKIDWLRITSGPGWQQSVRSPKAARSVARPVTRRRTTC
jgi:hypothetical protein